MNLLALTGGAVGQINPPVPAIVQQSTGYTIVADGTQIPSYTTIDTTIQMQALSGGDLKKLESLNIQGVQQKGYLTGDFEGVFRVLGKGGDLITVGNYTYLVSVVLERWADWVCVGLTMQVD